MLPFLRVDGCKITPLSLYMGTAAGSCMSGHLHVHLYEGAVNCVLQSSLTECCNGSRPKVILNNNNIQKGARSDNAARKKSKCFWLENAPIRLLLKCPKACIFAPSAFENKDSACMVKHERLYAQCATGEEPVCSPHPTVLPA